MGLTLTVGGVKSAFLPPFAGRLEAQLRKKFGLIFPPALGAEGIYYSDDLGWSWWKKLQDFAGAQLGAERCENLNAVDAWAGGYLPLDIAPQTIGVGVFGKTLVQLASLPRLLSELEQLSKLADLPFQIDPLQQLLAHYRDNAFVDDDPELQAYANLVLCGFVAQERSAAVWVVK